MSSEGSEDDNEPESVVDVAGDTELHNHYPDSIFYVEHEYTKVVYTVYILYVWIPKCNPTQSPTQRKQTPEEHEGDYNV